MHSRGRLLSAKTLPVDWVQVFLQVAPASRQGADDRREAPELFRYSLDKQ